MKILYLTTTDFSQPIGPSVNEYEFWLSLQESSLDVAGVAPEPSRPLADLNRERIHLVRLAANNKFGMIVLNQLGLLVTAWKILLQLRKDKPQLIVVCRLPFLPWSVALLMTAFPNIPFFFKSVGDTEFLHRYRGARRILSTPLRPIQSALVGFVLRRAAGLDACTEQLLAFLRSRYRLQSNKLKFVPNSTNVERFNPQGELAPTPFDDEAFVIGYIGGFPLVRGGSHVVELCALLRREYPSVRGLVIGGDDKELQRLAHDRQVADICVIMGKIPYADVPARYRRIDLVVAMEIGERSAELGNSGQKIRQALALGIPVITNPHCSPALRDSGFVWGAFTDDLAAISRYAREIIAWDGAKRTDFARECRAYAIEHFSTTATLRQRAAFWRERLSQEQRKDLGTGAKNAGPASLSLSRPEPSERQTPGSERAREGNAP